MVAAQPLGPIWTVEQYLDLERGSSVRHEFHQGSVYAMAGGTQTHAQIALNIGTFLRSAVRGTSCRAFLADIKVRQTAADYVYPDAVVTCDARDRLPSQDWIAFPVLVVEVLSPSTERYDRGAKFELYSEIPTLEEYVLVEYSRRAVEVWRRDEAGSWRMLHVSPGADVIFESIGRNLSVDLVYEDSGVE